MEPKFQVMAFRAMYLILRGQVRLGVVSEEDLKEWVEDYLEIGGGTITPRMD